MTVKTLKHKKLIITLIVIASIAALSVSAFFIVLKVGQTRLKNSLVAGETLDIVDDFDDSTDVLYNGKAYVYNDDLVNILLLGVDRERESGNLLGQADAVYLVSLDTKSNLVSVYAISRNTVTDVDIFDVEGEQFATEQRQLCLAYGYGKDDVQSSLSCAKAVSNLLYGVPINKYYTIFTNSVGEIVDAVGGVEVTLIEAMEHIFPGKHVGDTVTVTKKTALPYLQTRGESTNAVRLERQKAFISSFVPAAKSAMAKDWTLPVKMFDKLAENSITDLDATGLAYLASKAFDAEFKMVSLPGETGFDGTYETFDVDEDALYDLVINSFYRVK